MRGPIWGKRWGKFCPSKLAPFARSSSNPTAVLNFNSPPSGFRRQLRSLPFSSCRLYPCRSDSVLPMS
jgi:hypothetical protein